MLNFPLYCIKFVLFLPMCYISKMAEQKKKRKKKKRKEETIRCQFGRKRSKKETENNQEGERMAQAKKDQTGYQITEAQFFLIRFRNSDTVPLIEFVSQ